MKSFLAKTISGHRERLVGFLSPVMGRVAKQCLPIWNNHDKVSKFLGKQIQPWADLSFCTRLYAIFPSGKLHSDVLVTEDVAENQVIRYELILSYLSEGQLDELVLTEVYISSTMHRTCITAIQPITDGSEVIGYLVGDFDLRKLPQEERAIFPECTWRQLKGDPAIRSQLFKQTFVPGAMDEHVNDVLNIMDELVVERGIFRAAIRFPSSRATLWVLEDPYDEHTHILEEILDPSICLAYPRRPYPDNAKIMTDMVRPILDRFRQLRYGDDTIYLRTGILNIISGMVEVIFSCDGTHLMPAEMFLEKDDSFWFGVSGK